ncbi:MAG: aminotransferase class I/II-fold pyridoxal phosphate-dependent enzyme [Candidatus Nanoarchaeia archaeon]|nr:aminotransferase class I/II-fold pyridoxal phosphate-dependent enzyme [Candidatus Nanoarchaeia archaeon]
MKAIILAGGQKIKDKGREIPSPLVDLNGKKFLEYQIESLKKSYINDIILCVSSKKEIEEYFHDGSSHGVKLTYSEELNPLGTAGAIKKISKLIGDETFIVLNGDVYFEDGLKDLIEKHRYNKEKENILLTVGYVKVENSKALIAGLIDSEYIIKTLLKEKVMDFNNLTNSGVYILEPIILSFIKENEKVSLESQTFPLLYEKNLVAGELLAAKYFVDIGTIERLKSFRVYLKNPVKQIPVAEIFLNGKELDYLSDCLNTNWISSAGEYIKEFEDGFAKFIGSLYGVATNNGTSAIHLALAAVGIEKGDEVIVPSLTFISTANAVKYCNAVPVFIDSDRFSWNIDPKKIEEKITSKTKAIIVVHLYGNPCDMNPIMEIARKHHLIVIEDAAEAHGAEFKNQRVGSFGDISCFSFYGNKIITTGEGGMCLTNNKDLADKMKYLRDHGMAPEKKYWHDSIGFNFRMTNMQAAIGLAQLEKIDELVSKKVENANFYNKNLCNVKGITLPPLTPMSKNVYWMYTILIEKEYPLSKQELEKKLLENGIDTRPAFYPVTLMPPYKTNEKFPVAEEISRKGLTLPSSIKLTEEQINFICNIIKNN